MAEVRRALTGLLKKVTDELFWEVSKEVYQDGQCRPCELSQSLGASLLLPFSSLCVCGMEWVEESFHPSAIASQL